METIQLIELLNELVKVPNENEWVEFKLNFYSEEEIGERISALANGACIRSQKYAYLVYGVENGTHEILGTTFTGLHHKKGNEDLEHWLAQRLNPRIDFRIYEFDYDADKHMTMFVIPAAKSQPIEFMHRAYIRVGSITRHLSDFPDRAAKIWRKEAAPFERDIAKDGLVASDITKYLSTEPYFDLMKLPYPSTLQGVINKFMSEGLVVQGNGYGITKLGALLFAKDLRDFDGLERKTVRVIVYKGKSKLVTEREYMETKGYAVGFEGLINWINGQLPANEEIGKALRVERRMYPELALREILANAEIHQDLSEKGFIMVEIYADRIEISNPGIPLVLPERFIDAYFSRNEHLSDLMRRLGFCEEKGSGMDKVIAQNELFQLPPINIIAAEMRTRVTMYAYKTLNELDKREKVLACYQHACLKYVTNEKMTNQTLRDRFDIGDKNAAIASRIIREALDQNRIKESNEENTSKKYANYIPFWA